MNSILKYAKYQISFKLLLKNKEEILILRDNEDLWDLPGGRVDVSEIHTPSSIIIKREIEEELGKNIKYILKSPVMQFTRHLYGQKEPVLIIVFESEYLSGAINLSKEHKSYSWINLLGAHHFEKKDFFSKDEYFAFLEYFEKEKIKRKNIFFNKNLFQ